MKTIHIFLLMVFAVGMGLGQLLLKYSAIRQSININQDFMSRLFSLALDWPFIVGASSYAVLLVYWMWLLTFLPLSRAYPFTLLSVVVATVGSAVLFNEPITMRFLLGLVVVSAGLFLIGTE